MFVAAFLYGCTVPLSERISCLYDGLSKSDCELGGCCYDGTSQPSCYYSTTDTFGKFGFKKSSYRIIYVCKSEYSVLFKNILI